MSGFLAAVAVALAVVTVLPAPTAGRRLARLARLDAEPRVRTRPPVQAVWIAVPVVGLVAAATIGVWAGAFAAVSALLIGRRRPTAVASLDVPLVADLIAACLAAGATPSDALRAAAESSPEAGNVCRPVADRLAAGALPREAWQPWLDRPDLATIARACVRAADTGAATTQELRRAGDRARAQRRAELARRTHRAAVWAVLPLGVCFLPAFVLVGIVPFALGLLGR